MIVSALRNTNSISTILVTSVLFFGNFLLNIGEVFNESDVPVSKMVLSWGSVLCIVLLLNGYTQKFKFVGLGDGIAGAVFLSFMFGLKDPHLFYRELMGLCLILIVNIRLISLHNTPKNLLREFEIGLLLGLVMIISPGFLVVGIMFLIGLTLVVSFTWRDFLAPVLGVFWVFLIKYYYHFVFEEGPINEFFQLSISLPVFDFNWNIEMIEWMVLSLFVCMIFLRIFKVIEKRSVRVRVNYRIWIWTSVCLLLSLLFFQRAFSLLYVLQWLALLPCAIFSIEYFKLESSLKGRWKLELVFFCLMVVQLGIRFV